MKNNLKASSQTAIVVAVVTNLIALVINVVLFLKYNLSALVALLCASQNIFI